MPVPKKPAKGRVLSISEAGGCSTGPEDLGAPSVRRQPCAAVPRTLPVTRPWVPLSLRHFHHRGDRCAAVELQGGPQGRPQALCFMTAPGHGSGHHQTAIGAPPNRRRLPSKRHRRRRVPPALPMDCTTCKCKCSGSGTGGGVGGGGGGDCQSAPELLMIYGRSRGQCLARASGAYRCITPAHLSVSHPQVVFALHSL